MLKLYKRTLKTTKAQHTLKQILGKLEKPKLNKTEGSRPVTQYGDIWINHFKNLYSNKQKLQKTIEQTQITEDFTEDFNKLELAIKDSQNPLDIFITENEVEEKSNNLKPKKSSRIDDILNEMLKHSSKKIRLAILKVLNFILSVGYFPDI